MDKKRRLRKVSTFIKDVEVYNPMKRAQEIKEAMHRLDDIEKKKNEN